MADSGAIYARVHIDDRDALVQLNKLRDKIQKMHEELDSRKQKRNEIEQQMRETQAAVEATTKSIEEMNAQLAESKAFLLVSQRDGLAAQMNEAKGEIERTTQTINELTARLDAAKQAIATNNFGKDLSPAEFLEAMDAAKADVATLPAKIKEANATLKVQQKELAAIEKQYASINEQVERSGYGDMVTNYAYGTPEYAADVARAQSIVDETPAKIKSATDELKAQKKELDSLTGQYTKLNDQIQVGEHNLALAESQARELKEQIENTNVAAQQFDEAMEGIKKQMNKVGDGIKRMLRRIILYSLLREGWRALRDFTASYLKVFPEFNAAMAKFKGNMLIAIQPLVNVVIPALIRFVQILRDAAAVLGDIVARIFNTTTAESKESAEALYNQADALKKTGGAAKKAAKQFANFDEINQLTDNKGGGGGGTDANLKPDFASDILDNIRGIELLTGEALLVIGAVLAFSGVNIPLGITLMALGAAAVYSAVKGDWSELQRQMQGTIGQIFTIIAAAALVVGAILTFSNVNLPLGIALMAIGAAGLATSVALNWDGIKKKLKSPVGGAMALLSAFPLVIGAILAFSTANIPLGIALMVAGAAGLASTISLNWDTIKNFIKDNLGNITTITGASLLALGVILTMSGAATPLGIALLAAGAASLVASAAVNWNKLKETLTGQFAGIRAVALAGLLVLGIIMVASGVFLPLGVALIAAGAAGLVTVTALNWNAIKEKIAMVWNGIKTWWRENVAPVFTREFWREKFDTIREGLEMKVKDAVNAAIKLMNKFIDWVNEKLTFSWKGLNVLGEQVIPAGSFQLLKIPKIPQLAQGAVIPPNREFLAMLGDQKSGTNIEAPLDTIVQAFRQALGGMGGTRQPVILEVNGVEFGRVVLDAYNAESQRVGIRMGGR